MAPFEWRLTATWAKLGAPGAEEYMYVLAILPPSDSVAHYGTDSNTASALHLVLVKPSARANTTEWALVFQINLGPHVHALERLLPNVRIEAIRRHRALVASNRGHFVQAWLNDVENDTPLRDTLVDQMRHGGHLYSEQEAALIAQRTAQLDAFARGEGQLRSLKHSKTVKVARVWHDKKTGRFVGEVECLFHASLEQIVAYLMHFESKIRKSQLSIEVVRHEKQKACTIRSCSRRRRPDQTCQIWPP